MRRCKECQRPSFAEYCSPQCAAAAVTRSALAAGAFPESEHDAVKRSIEELRLPPVRRRAVAGNPSRSEPANEQT